VRARRAAILDKPVIEAIKQRRIEIIAAVDSCRRDRRRPSSTGVDMLGPPPFAADLVSAAWPVTD
jgi:hypothetical protein